MRTNQGFKDMRKSGMKPQHLRLPPLVPLLFHLLLLLLVIPGLVALLKDPVAVKLVKDTTNYNYRGATNALQGAVKLTLRANPANFSGPDNLHALVGHCFNHSDKSYRYEVCPFDNITQHELSSPWQAYHGVIGLWSGNWIIVNNTFKGMLFEDGDDCHSTKRRATVNLICGKIERIINVTEPKRCEYLVVFETRLVCHPQALLVYPRLESTLRRRWDLIWTAFKSEKITLNAYQQYLESIFVDAGLERRPRAMGDNPSLANQKQGKLFNDVNECSKAYASLSEEMEKLRKVGNK